MKCQACRKKDCKDIQKCSTCRESYCSDCLSNSSIPYVYIHQQCVGRDKKCPYSNIICGFSNQCVLCSSYTEITPYVAIGNADSPYDSFDVIVDLNYPQNGVAHHMISSKEENGKIIYKVGIYDSVNEKEYMEIVLHVLMNEMVHYEKSKILFHCFAGISRSSTIAIAYLAKINHISLHDAFSLISSKRPHVCPNDGFMDILTRFCNS